MGESAAQYDGIVEVVEVEAPKVDLDPDSPFFDRYEYFRPRRKRIFAIQIMVSLLTQISNTIYFPLIVTIESTLKMTPSALANRLDQMTCKLQVLLSLSQLLCTR